MYFGHNKLYSLLLGDSDAVHTNLSVLCLLCQAPRKFVYGYTNLNRSLLLYRTNLSSTRVWSIGI